MKHFVFAAFLTLFSVQASAQEQSPEMIRFAKAIGIYEQVDAQKAALSAQTSDLGQQYIQQIMAAVPEAPEGLEQDLRGAFGTMSSRIAELIDTNQAVGTYLDLIAGELSKKEIKKVTKFYESALGQKFTGANSRVMADWTTSFNEDLNTRAGAVIETYVADLKAIVGRYAPSE